MSLTISHVLFHIKGGPTVSINIVVLPAQIVFLVGSKSNHLIETHGLCLPAAVEPELEDGLLRDTPSRAKVLVIVELHAHKICILHEGELVTKVWDLARIQV